MKNQELNDMLKIEFRKCIRCNRKFKLKDIRRKICKVCDGRTRDEIPDEEKALLDKYILVDQMDLRKLNNFYTELEDFKPLCSISGFCSVCNRQTGHNFIKVTQEQLEEGYYVLFYVSCIDCNNVTKRRAYKKTFTQ